MSILLSPSSKAHSVSCLSGVGALWDKDVVVFGACALFRVVLLCSSFCVLTVRSWNARLLLLD